MTSVTIFFRSIPYQIWTFVYQTVNSACNLPITVIMSMLPFQGVCRKEIWPHIIHSACKVAFSLLVSTHVVCERHSAIQGLPEFVKYFAQNSLSVPTQVSLDILRERTPYVCAWVFFKKILLGQKLCEFAPQKAKNIIHIRSNLTKHQFGWRNLWWPSLISHYVIGHLEYK